MRTKYSENEISRRKTQAKSAGDASFQLGDFNRPRRRFVLGAWLNELGRRLRSGGDVMASTMNRQRQANRSAF